MIIACRDITKTYRLGHTIVPALHAATMTVQRGEFVVIAGASGSGKTTLLNIMGGIDRPDSGDYVLDGTPMMGLSESLRTRIRRQKVGFVFQSFNLIPVLSAYENVAYPLWLAGESPKSQREKVMYWLNRVGLSDQSQQRPNALSGGQRQRVAIARALVKSPAVIVADEPTASLDSKTGASIIELMRELIRDQGTTCVVSSHDTMVIQSAERVVYMRDGRMDKEVNNQ